MLFQTSSVKKDSGYKTLFLFISALFLPNLAKISFSQKMAP